MMDDGWIEHNGMACPVSENVRVVVQFRSGALLEHRLAGDWEWNHTGEGRDIIAYKLADPIAERIAKSGFIPDKSGHTVVAKPRQHITDAAWEKIGPYWSKYYTRETYEHGEIRKRGVMVVTVAEWDERKTIEYYDFYRAAIFDGHRWYRDDSHCPETDELRQQLDERDARIAELEQQYDDLMELVEEADARITQSEFEADDYVNPRDKALALSFAPDPSDPRLGRSSGR